MSKPGLWDQLVDCICRPPRDKYVVEDLLGGHRGAFRVSRFEGTRKDITLVNKQGLKLQCSHFIPKGVKGKEGKLPCVLYCHCNSGSRRDSEEAVYVLLPLGVSVFAMDFAGSGLSDGQWVTLGSTEVEDVEIAVKHLREKENVSTVGLWGRSMGAVTALLYSARDPSIAGVVIDSPFARLTDLMMEIIEAQKLPVPKALMKMAVSMMRRSVRKRAGFDIQTVSPLDVVGTSFIPALFGHAHGDSFIRIHHSQQLYDAYMGDKNFIKFDGDHNSHRPEFFYNSASIFFHNTLQLDQMLEGGNRLNKEVIRAFDTMSKNVPAHLRDRETRQPSHTQNAPWTLPAAASAQDQQNNLKDISALSQRSGTNGANGLNGVIVDSDDEEAVLAAAAAGAQPFNRNHEGMPSNVQDEEAQLMRAIQLSLLEMQGAGLTGGAGQQPPPSDDFEAPFSTRGSHGRGKVNAADAESLLAMALTLSLSPSAAPTKPAAAATTTTTPSAASVPTPSRSEDSKPSQSDSTAPPSEANLNLPALWPTCPIGVSSSGPAGSSSSAGQAPSQPRQGSCPAATDLLGPELPPPAPPSGKAARPSMDYNEEM